jgi:hypothetical protein
MVLGRAKTTNSDEVWPKSGHGAAAQAAGGQQDPLTLPRSNQDRPNEIQRPGNAHTPSAVTFSKEPLSYLNIEPAVQSVFVEYVFCFRKRKASLLFPKYVFSNYTFATDFI